MNTNHFELIREFTHWLIILQNNDIYEFEDNEIAGVIKTVDNLIDQFDESTIEEVMYEEVMFTWTKLNAVYDKIKKNNL